MYRKYHEFWVEGKTVPDDGTPLRTDELATVDIIEAKNYREAQSIAAKRYPGHTCEVSRTG
jgi:hypothetical protein